MIVNWHTKVSLTVSVRRGPHRLLVSTLGVIEKSWTRYLSYDFTKTNYEYCLNEPLIIFGVNPRHKETVTSWMCPRYFQTELSGRKDHLCSPCYTDLLLSCSIAITDFTVVFIPSLSLLLGRLHIHISVKEQSMFIFRTSNMWALSILWALYKKDHS